MDIVFETRKLAKVFNNESQLKQKYGDRAKLLKRRFYEMSAAGNLEELRSLPQTRCHELKEDRIRILGVEDYHG